MYAYAIPTLPYAIFHVILPGWFVKVPICKIGCRFNWASIKDEVSKKGPIHLSFSFYSVAILKFYCFNSVRAALNFSNSFPG